MNIEEIRNYCLSKKCVTEGFPFDVDTLAFKIAGKIFAISALEKEPNITLKCKAEKSIELRDKYNFIEEAHHLNKRYWITIYLKNNIDGNLILSLIDESYDLVFNKLPVKSREIIDRM